MLKGLANAGIPAWGAVTGGNVTAGFSLNTGGSATGVVAKLVGSELP